MFEKINSELDFVAIQVKFNSQSIGPLNVTIFLTTLSKIHLLIKEYFMWVK